ncbi:hypothetical protein [Pedobacter foliorum]|uniref:hypothetical protein n=1 Tax=Pedobacter foliorum TaxID=2739058 RepID=UPI00156642AF|nr:hypothetical protein [Pedobacter foliorum]NRF38354.1 hypothetical protein [Pedobacter foliorum]
MAIKSPVDVVGLTLCLEVKVSDTIIPDYYSLISVETHHEVNHIAYAELIFAGGAMEPGVFPISDSDSFVSGNKIEILAGYSGEDKVSVFNGVIVKESIEVSGNGGFRLMVSCKQEAIGMTFNHIDVTMLELSAEPVLRLAFGESIQSFNVESNMFTEAATEKSEIEVNPDASLVKIDQPDLKGSVSFQGNGAVHPGEFVLLEGVGSRYSGKAFVSSVSHHIEDGIWKTTVGFSKTPPYLAKDDDNYVKSIVSKWGLKIIFDDTKRAIKLETPGGNSFVLDDENKKIVIADHNANVICMDSNGISMESYKDVNLKARGDIRLNADGKIELAAKMDAVVSGLNVYNKAQVSFVAEGVRTAEISSSAQTKVKGAIVMIN